MRQDEFWFKDAIIYAIDVMKYKDGNGDGIGDFKGLMEKLDYIQSLGVTCLWLLPFFPTPNRDNGYDIIDYYNVNPEEGTFEEFLEFMKEAKKRGLKILIDLVVHHTSDKHPWFLASKNDKNSKFRNYYVWTEKLPPDADKAEFAFPGSESSPWTYDETAEAYYHHWFYSFQPDLNINNTEVQREIRSIIDFWLAFDVDGFRMDAISHMIQRKGLPGTEIEDPEHFLKNMNDYVVKRKKTAVLLAEADVEPDQMKTYFGEGERMDLLYNFVFDNFLFLALAKKNADPLLESLSKTEAHFDKSQWANFIRNLDELDLERLTEKDRELVLDTFAPEENMRIYNRGIRRRFAPMMKGNRKAMEMTYSLLFSLPGAPVVPYGDEIGMGDDLSQPERNSVRTPMQWDNTMNAGFSDSENIICPVIAEGDFSYHKINVQDQLKKEESFLNWFKQVTAIRNKYIHIITAGVDLVKENNPEIFTHSSVNHNKKILFIHNLSDKDESYVIDEGELKNCKVSVIFSNKDIHDIKTPYLDLDGYGYYWILFE